MKKNVFLCLLAGACILASCKKKNNEPEPATPGEPGIAAHNYMPMKIGNYWIYDQYSVDPAGAETFNHTDSVYISKDTVIGSYTYYIFEGVAVSGGYPPRLMLRQQNSDLIASDGSYYYKYDDTTTVLENFYDIVSATDTVYHLESRMGYVNQPVTVAAGTYITTGITSRIAIWPNYKGCCDTLYKYRRFAENIGVVSDVVIQFASGNHIDRRLRRYHVN